MKLLLSFLLLLGWVLHGHAAGRPNLLFVFADDMTYDAVRALGDEGIETPHLDLLVESGTTFSHAYNSGAWGGAVCIASRTMLITGRQLWNARAFDNRDKIKSEFVAPGRTWPQLLAKAGYRTFLTGKWHVKAAPEEVFDVVRHVRPGMPKSVKHAYNRPLAGEQDPWDPADRSLGGFWEGGTHWSAVQADDAVGFVREASRDEEPFFIYLAFNAPHDPRQSPQRFLDQYPLEEVAVPPSFLPAYPYREAMGCPHALRDEKLAPMPRTRHAVRVHRREDYALVSHLDAQIGRVLDALEASGEADNTYVVFTADHGLAVGKHGLLGKQSMYDHSVRVPFVVKGPGIAAGRTIAAPIYLQDVIPTTLDWAGVATPDTVEFESLTPHLEGKGSSRDFVYTAYRDRQRAITSGGYKLIVYPEAKRARLYHLAEDPDELVDLLEKGKGKGVAKRLYARLRAVQPEFGDTLELELEL